MADIPDPLAPIAAALLADLCCRLAESDYPVCHCGFGLGDPPPMSFCCECDPAAVDDPVPQGEAWVRIGPVFPADALLSPLGEPDQRCPLGLIAVQITMGIYRCAPTMDDNGNPPSTEDIAAALAIQLQDRALLFRVARCVMAAGSLSHVIGGWDPIELQGGCMGSQLALTVGVADCLTCPQCPQEDP